MYIDREPEFEQPSTQITPETVKYILEREANLKARCNPIRTIEITLEELVWGEDKTMTVLCEPNGTKTIKLEAVSTSLSTASAEIITCTQEGTFSVDSLAIKSQAYVDTANNSIRNIATNANPNKLQPYSKTLFRYPNSAEYELTAQDNLFTRQGWNISELVNGNFGLSVRPGEGDIQILDLNEFVETDENREITKAALARYHEAQSLNHLYNGVLYSLKLINIKPDNVLKPWMGSLITEGLKNPEAVSELESFIEWIATLYGEGRFQEVFASSQQDYTKTGGSNIYIPNYLDLITDIPGLDPKLKKGFIDVATARQIIKKHTIRHPKELKNILPTELQDLELGISLPFFETPETRQTEGAKREDPHTDEWIEQRYGSWNKLKEFIGLNDSKLNEINLIARQHAEDQFNSQSYNPSTVESIQKYTIQPLIHLLTYRKLHNGVALKEYHRDIFATLGFKYTDEQMAIINNI
jgi:hypothetical protein